MASRWLRSDAPSCLARAVQVAPRKETHEHLCFLVTRGPRHWKNTLASAFASLRETCFCAKGAFAATLVFCVAFATRLREPFWSTQRDQDCFLTQVAFANTVRAVMSCCHEQVGLLTCQTDGRLSLTNIERKRSMHKNELSSGRSRRIHWPSFQHPILLASPAPPLHNNCRQCQCRATAQVSLVPSLFFISLHLSYDGSNEKVSLRYDIVIKGRTHLHPLKQTQQGAAGNAAFGLLEEISEEALHRQERTEVQRALPGGSAKARRKAVSMSWCIWVCGHLLTPGPSVLDQEISVIGSHPNRTSKVPTIPCCIKGRHCIPGPCLE